MKVPTCKLCGKAHWSYEDHAGMETEVPEYVKEIAKGALGTKKASNDIPVMKGRYEGSVTTTPSYGPPSEASVTQQTCNACNKPLHNRGKVCNACRQRAYRERK